MYFFLESWKFIDLPWVQTIFWSWFKCSKTFPTTFYIIRILIKYCFFVQTTILIFHYIIHFFSLLLFLLFVVVCLVFIWFPHFLVFYCPYSLDHHTTTTAAKYRTVVVKTIERCLLLKRKEKRERRKRRRWQGWLRENVSLYETRKTKRVLLILFEIFLCVQSLH